MSDGELYHAATTHPWQAILILQLAMLESTHPVTHFILLLPVKNYNHINLQWQNICVLCVRGHRDHRIGSTSITGLPFCVVVSFWNRTTAASPQRSAPVHCNIMVFLNIGRTIMLLVLNRLSFLSCHFLCQLRKSHKAQLNSDNGKCKLPSNYWVQ